MANVTIINLHNLFSLEPFSKLSSSLTFLLCCSESEISTPLTIENAVKGLRVLEINKTFTEIVSNSYKIFVYTHEKNKDYETGNLLCVFNFSINLHKEIGIFNNKGFLIDEHGYRLSVSVI